MGFIKKTKLDNAGKANVFAEEHFCADFGITVGKTLSAREGYDDLRCCSAPWLRQVLMSCGVGLGMLCNGRGSSSTRLWSIISAVT